MKAQREFLDTSATPWVPDVNHPGVSERVLSRDDRVIFTRLARWEAGLDTSTGQGVIRHDYVEEVYILQGDLTDLTLQQTFGEGHYACRPPQMPHGPYRTTSGCTMLEIRYHQPSPGFQLERFDPGT